MYSTCFHACIHVRMCLQYYVCCLMYQYDSDGHVVESTNKKVYTCICMTTQGHIWNCTCASIHVFIHTSTYMLYVYKYM